MLKTLALKNFQSHEDTEVELHLGVNVFVGSSDSGKSALLRALRWLTMNRPSGESFRSHWGGDTEVVLELEDGTSVSRKKGRENIYRLNDLVFKAFGNEVPEEVATALRLDGINVQRQLDAPYLLSETPGEVARQLNSVVRLDDIDTAATRINGIIRGANACSEVEKERVNRLEAQHADLAWVDAAHGELETLEDLKQRREGAWQARSGLFRLLEGLGEGLTTVVRYKGVEDAQEALTSLLQAQTKLETLKKTREELADLLFSFHRAEERAAKYATATEAEEELSTMSVMAERYNMIRGKRDRLAVILDACDSAQHKMTTYAETARKLQKEFDDAMPETCPLCGK